MIAGVVIGSIVGIVLVVAVIMKVKRRRPKGQRLLDESTSNATHGETIS